MAIPVGSVQTVERMDKMVQFFFWASWACSTERPGKDITYTHNWPNESLIGNTPTSDLLLVDDGKCYIVTPRCRNPRLCACTHRRQRKIAEPNRRSTT